MNLNPYRRETKQHVIAALLLEGKTQAEVYKALFPLVMRQIEPMVFGSYTGRGESIPKSINSQIAILTGAIYNTRKDLLAKRPEAYDNLAYESRSDSKRYASKFWRSQLIRETKIEWEAANSGNIPENHAVPETVAIEPVIEQPQAEEKIEVKDTLRSRIEYLQRRLYEIREFVQSRRTENRDFDYVSYRAFEHGRDAVYQGILPDDFLWSIGASWDEDTRRQAGLNYDVDYAKYAIPGTPLHLGFMVRLAKAGIPIFLCGPVGSGKSMLTRHLAEYLELEYGEIPLSLGVSRTDLFGSWNAQGFVTRPLPIRYGNGGVFCFEEIDAADPNVLLSVNNAVANNSLFNTSNGEEIKRDENYIPAATANTWGNGATANHAAREGLDASTLDRFKYGRIYIGYQREIEDQILFGDLAEIEENWTPDIAWEPIVA